MSVWETRVQDFAVYAKESGVQLEKPDFAQGPTHPVVNVSWEEAKKFAEWLSKKEGREYRLPTDEEWSVEVGLGREKGVSPRAKEENGGDVYPWGGSYPPGKGDGNYYTNLYTGGSRTADDGYKNTAPVGSFAANRLGIFDMGGNVLEWCEDLLEPGSPFRVLRGASWIDITSVYLRSACRYGGRPTDRDDRLGFRVVVGVSGR